jgi:protein phosphatase
VRGSVDVSTKVTPRARVALTIGRIRLDDGDGGPGDFGRLSKMTTNTRLRAVAAGLSDVGLQRDHNEDSLVIVGEDGPFVVADGMGGHRAGDVASRLATEAIAEQFRSSSREPVDQDGRFSDEENLLLSSIRLANRRILERSMRSRDLQGMGTTVVCALFHAAQNRMIVAHVGDSRAYRLRDRFLTQLTRDHSLFNDYLTAMPDLSEEQRSELPRNVITRALGMQEDIAVDLQSDEAQPGDVYVLCSDGLSGMLEDEDIIDVLSSNSDLEESCRLLVRRANENGGEDNVTALLVRVEPWDGNYDDGATLPRRGTNTIPIPGGAETSALEDTPPAAPSGPRG